MSIYNTIISRRTIRKFKQIDIPIDTLKKLVNAGRLAPSAGNLQPIEYLIVINLFKFPNGSSWDNCVINTHFSPVWSFLYYDYHIINL